MNVTIYKRDFSSLLSTQPFTLAPQRYSFSAIGGPKKADLKAEGDEAALWGLVELLRCPVEIISDAADYLWWGYINSVELQLGDVSVTADIDTMSNLIAVAYTENSTGGKSRKTTTWVGDADSEAEYGIKELLKTSSGSSAAHALAAQTALLAQKRYPQPAIKWRSGGGSPSGSVRCRGWWQTMAWRYYSNANTTAVDTATQINDIATTSGQFITSVEQVVTSGITLPIYRDGDATAQYEAEELMTMGTSNNRRILADVDHNRKLRIYEEPTSSSPLFLRRDGSLSTELDVDLRRETCPVGKWALLRDVIPNSVDVSKLSNPQLVFIEENEYDVEKDKLTPTPRGMPNPFDLLRMKDG